MLDKFNAVEGVTEYVIPDRWTSGHVAHRLISAYETLRLMPDRIGPSGYGSAWPSVRLEFADLLEESARTYRQQEVTREDRRPSPVEVDLCLEAIGWPIRYLRDLPKEANAVSVWAVCRAHRRALRALLRARQRRLRGRDVSEVTFRRHVRSALQRLSDRLQQDRIPVR